MNKNIEPIWNISDKSVNFILNSGTGYDKSSIGFKTSEDMMTYWMDNHYLDSPVFTKKLKLVQELVEEHF